MKSNTSKILSEANDYIQIAIGLLMYALAWNMFFFPHEVAGGGATGIATIIMYGTRGLLPEGAVHFFNSLGMASEGGGVPVSVTFFVLNGILLFFSVKELGWKFSIRSIYGVGALTLWLWIPFRDLYAEIIGSEFPIFDPFMSVIIGGIIAGIGMSMVFTHNGSSGGTDIIAKIINKYRSISLGKSLLIADIIVITSVIFLPYGSLEKVVYGYIVTFVMTTTIDWSINGTRQSVQFFIFSPKFEEIADAISQEAHRGVTLLNGEGWYSKKDIKVVTVLVRKHESNQILKIVKNIDPKAFIAQSAAMGVYGQGFEEIGQK